MKYLVLLMISGIALLSSNIAKAEPIYLDCFTKFENDPEKKFSVKLDEETGKITHTGSNSAFNADGFYGPNKISYQNISSVGSGILMIRKLVINRTTLMIEETFTVKSTRSNIDSKSIPPATGFCSVIEVSDRKI